MRSQYYSETQSEKSSAFLNKSRWLLLVLALFMALCYAGSVSAGVCVAVPTDACTLEANTSTVLNLGSYNLNASTGSNAIRVNGDNVTLDCNGSTIYGNFTDALNPAISSQGIAAQSARNNITIKNCIVNNYRDGIRMRGANWTIINTTLNSSYNNVDFEFTNNSVISNFRIGDFYQAGVYIAQSYNNILSGINVTSLSLTQNLIWFDINANNNTLTGSLIRGGYVQVKGSFNNISFSNFSLGNKTYDYGSIFFTNPANSNNLFNNTFSGNASMISLEGGTLNRIFFNNVINITQQSHCIGAKIGTANFSIFNNNIDGCDIGILVSKVSGGNSIYNNTIQNTFNHFDGYDAGIFFEIGRDCNTIVDGNNITNFGSVGIGLKNCTNVNLTRNTMSALVNRQNQGYYDYFESPTCIGLYEDYKGFSGEGQATQGWGYSDWIKYRNKNIIVSSNICLNTAVILLDKGTINLTQDISNYWFRKIQSNSLSDFYSFYISNNYTNVSRIDSSYVLNYSLGICSLSNCSLLHQEFYNYQYLFNLQIQSNQYNIYNKSNALFHNSTNLCTGSSSDISSNDDNVNITLSPSNFCYVLDEFNLTESLNRTNNPITIINKSNNGAVYIYYLNNSLRDTVYNLTFVPLNTSLGRCPSASSLTLNNLNIIHPTCVNGIYTISSLDSGQANILTLDFTDSNPDSGGGGGGGSNGDSTNQNTIHSQELCTEIKSFVSGKAVSGLTFNEIPQRETTALITTLATKYFLDENLVHNYVYNYPIKCSEAYPTPAWLWLRNNWLALTIVLGAVSFIYLGLKKI